MIAQYLAFTQADFTRGSGVVKFEVSNYDYFVMQPITLSGGGSIAVASTLNGGAVQGTSEGSVTTAANFSTLTITKLSDNSSVTAMATTDLLYRGGVAGRYIQLTLTGTVTQVIVMLTKIT